MASSEKTSYNFLLERLIFPVFYRSFSDAKKSKKFFSLLSNLFSFFSFHVSTFIFLLIIDNLCERKIIQTIIIMHNYETMLAIVLGNLNNYVVKSKKSENNSAPSWVRTRALVVRRLERRPLTCETIPTALRVLVTWPTARDASFSYEFYFEKSCCCWWNRFPTVRKQICFSKCKFYIAMYRWSLVIENFIKSVFKI